MVVLRMVGLVPRSRGSLKTYLTVVGPTWSKSRGSVRDSSPQPYETTLSGPNARCPLRLHPGGLGSDMPGTNLLYYGTKNDLLLTDNPSYCVFYGGSPHTSLPPTSTFRPEEYLAFEFVVVVLTFT